MRSLLICAVLLLGSVLNVAAQKEIDEETPWSFDDRSYAGLGLGGLSFGSHSFYGQYFSIGVGALGGYMLTKNLSAGVGFEYQYTSYGDANIKNHVYGGYPFVRYNIRNFFVQFDYDYFWLKTTMKNVGEATAREERFFGGVGFFGSGNGRVTTNFLISYDFFYDSSSLFSSPLNTRLFFTF